MMQNKKSKIVDYYLYEGVDNKGRTLKSLWEKSNFSLEIAHDYIQWMFPLNEGSNYNANAPILTEDDIYIFRKSMEAKQNMLCSLERMLEFYGLYMIIDEDGYPIIEMNLNGGKNDFQQRCRNWISRNKHNYLRITRILKSLCLFGLETYAKALLKCLEEIYHSKRAISEKTFDYWKDAVL